MRMGTRREGRELAVQALYQLEVTNDEAGGGLETFWQHFNADDVSRGFARSLVGDVQSHRHRIDSLIADAAEHWQVGRLSKVDLSVLRVATCELVSAEDTPTRVTIDEAIEIARRFGSEDSAGFVNGVLDRIADVLGVKGRGDA